MKRVTFAAALVALGGSVGVANAQNFGVYVGPDHPGYYRHHHHWRGAYAYDRDCRVVVRTHINRWGHRVTVRKRICD
jgi:hypothetical protein